MKYKILLLACALLLPACQKDELVSSKAKDTLITSKFHGNYKEAWIGQYGNSSKNQCDRDLGNGDDLDDCAYSGWNALVTNNILLKKKGLRGTSINEELLQKSGWEKYVRKSADPTKKEFFLFKYKLGEILRIIPRMAQTDDCDSIVEYTVEIFDHAPWATELDKYVLMTSYEACFVKYDDGWRIK